MLQGSTTADIISKFETYLDDGTELSSQEELELCNKKYHEVCDDRPWEFLRKPATGTVTVSNGVAYIPLPADFREMGINNEYTDNTTENQSNAGQRVVFLAAASGIYTPYQVINYADRRQYVNNVGFVYIDMPNNRLTFTAPPQETDQTYEFDYIMVPPDLDVLSSNPLFPVRFWDIIYHMMAVDDQIIQIQDRAHSYMAENQQMADKFMLQLAYWNAKLLNN